MIKFFKFLVPGLAASLIGLISLPAQAILVIQKSTFYFSGNCEDCAEFQGSKTYQASGTLVLKDYVQGDAITQDKFVSFSYNRSNLQDPYNILASSLSSVDGNISFKSPENVFHLIGVNNNTKYYFDLFSNGRWDTGFVRGQQQKSADFGGSGNFGPNAVPKPATMLLMGGALAAAGLARRRRQR